MVPRSEQAPKLAALLYAAAIFVVNIFVCWNLLHLEFSSQMQSIESVYLGISRWAFDNWGDLNWNPLWYDGMPFYQVYQPGLHLTVAAAATITGLSIERVYHLLTALTYSGSALALYWLCKRAWSDSFKASATALFYSLISPSCFLVSGIRADAGGWFSPRRFQVLTYYGEGPHVTALAMIPLAIGILHAALFSQCRWYRLFAPFAIAAIVLTNWPGTIGLALAIAAYLLSRLGDLRVSHWTALITVGIASYLIVSPWIPPSILSLILKNAKQTDGTQFGLAQVVPILLLILTLIVLFAIFKIKATNRWIRFFIFYAAITGFVSIGREWFNWRLLPQPNRFHLEFEMAVAPLIALTIVGCFQCLPLTVRRVAFALLLAAVAIQAAHVASIARSFSQPIDITSTIEYRMSHWMDDNLKGQRVFAPGNVGLWMNTFVDVPQMTGCCDQSVSNQEYRIAPYAIYTGQNAGDQDAAISLLWLRTYGASAIGVTGPNSTESFKPFWNWKKFDGVLKELWRDGDNVIYQVPRRSDQPVRVIPKQTVVPRAPENGLDVEPLRPFVAALEDPSLPSATMAWKNRHEFTVDADPKPGQVVFLQIGYDKDWHALQGGVGVPIVGDPLGMMYVDAKPGGGPIQMTFKGGPGVPSVQWIMFGIGVGLVLFVGRRQSAT